MRVLHTSDWHVGRAGHRLNREEEHRAVLAEIGGIIRGQGVDLVLIAGDIFDHSAPTATSEEIVYKALLDFTASGAQVVMIAGNHDHPARLAAVRPLLKFANIHVGANFLEPVEGGCLDITLRTGEHALVAMMPWFSRSRIISVDDLMNSRQADHQQKYHERYKRILDYMCSGFEPSAVNLVMAHVVITGAIQGGGERLSETIEDYWVPAPELNVNAQYVALGHYHKAQDIKMLWPTFYSGSPLQLDFGEEKDVKSVYVFDAKPGIQVRTPKAIELKSGRRMITVRGNLQHLAVRKPEFGDAYLRVYVDELLRPGIADEVRELLPNAVEVKIDTPLTVDSSWMSRQGMQPRDLLASYFEQANLHDEGALKLFDDLVEEDNAPASA